MVRYKLLSALVVLCPLLPCSSADPQPAPNALREKVLKADTPDEKAKAYKDLFLAVGKAGLTDLMKDEDTGIALQAAWETHKKAITRPKPINLRSESVYDPAELRKFLRVVNDRAKTKVPGWWAENLLVVDVTPGKGHGFAEADSAKLREAKAGMHAMVADGAELESFNGGLVYSADGRSVRFPAGVLDIRSNAVTSVFVGKSAVVAAYSPDGGFKFKLAGFAADGGKPKWTAHAWAAGRFLLTGSAPHRVVLVAREDLVYVFGAESGGAYLEAFDLQTGKCRFRFCTGYWFNFSEEWG